MIHLYKSTNTNYEMNGDYTLSPEECIFECNLNDTWTLTISVPLVSKSTNSIVDDLTIGAVIGAPTPYGDKQLFRIYDVDKNDDAIEATALPIFLDSKNDCFLWDVRPTYKTGQEALDIMLVNNKYSASSNITKVNTAYYVQKNFIEALNGNDENSFLNRWGGEIVYNNYQIIVNERIGADNGLRVEFGFNLLGVSEKINTDNVVTRIVPKAYNGYILPNNETVDSPLIDNYPVVYTRVIEYDDIKLVNDAQENDAKNGVTVCDTLNNLYTALRQRANEEYQNGIDLPVITYDVDMVDLSKTELYKDYKGLLNVNLGDTVHIKNKKLNITTDARVIQLTYDCITKKVKNLVLGDYEANYFNDVSSITNSAEKVIDTTNNTLMADKIRGVVDLLNTSLRAQKDISQTSDVRAILFEDLDENSPTFGAMSMGTQGIQISKQRNETNTEWVWGTAINFESVMANYIITGILSDKLGNNYWDLDTGEFRLSAQTTIDDKEIATKDETTQYVLVEYALGSSSQTPPTDGWSTSSPQWEEGKYIWQRIGVKYADSTVEYEDPVCIQGAKGDKGDKGDDGSNGTDGKDGTDGVGVDDYYTEYYLSTSNTTQSGGSWTTQQPEWIEDHYIWIRTKITYTNGVIETTEAILAQSINKANETAKEANDKVDDLDESLNAQGVFNRLTNNGQIQGIYMQDGNLYVNATYIATGILADALGKFYLDMINGVVKIQDGEFTGKVTSKEGEIGGFVVRNSGISKSSTTSSSSKKMELNSNTLDIMMSSQYTYGSSEYYYESALEDTRMYVSYEVDGATKKISVRPFSITFSGKNTGATEETTIAQIQGYLTGEQKRFVINSLGLLLLHADGKVQIETSDGNGIEFYASRPFIDFHAGNSGSDYTHRLLAETGGALVAYPSIANGSDRRLKKDFEDIGKEYIEVLKGLKPQKYRYKKQDKYLNIGFIAQEVQEALKSAGIEDMPFVQKDNLEGYYTLDYSQIASLAVYGWQEHEKEIEDLKKEIKKIKGGNKC